MNPLHHTNTVYGRQRSASPTALGVLRVAAALALAAAIFYAGWQSGLSVGALRAENDMRDPATDSGGAR